MTNDELLSSALDSRKVSTDKFRLLAFYCKLAITLIDSKAAFLEFIKTKLNSRGYVFYHESISYEDLKLWIEWIETIAFPCNNAAVALIMSNVDLFETLPFPLVDLVEYQSFWNIEHVRWLSEGKKYSFNAGRNFPSYLDEWIRNQAAELIDSLEDEDLKKLEAAIWQNEVQEP